MDFSKYPEKYWHLEIRLTGKKHSLIKNDVSLKHLYNTYVKPWCESQKAIVDGNRIDFSSIVSFKIVHTSKNLEYYKKKNIEEMGHSLLYQDLRLLPLNKGIEYNIYELYESITNQKKIKRDSTKVFIVHGHDIQAMKKTKNFIEKMGLKPIVLHMQANKGKTIIEKFEEHSEVGFAVVLLTPDDFGGSNINPRKKNCRARQNVILELGFFMGKLGRNNVCALHKGNVELPSDINGVLYINMDEPTWKDDLLNEFEAAGLPIDKEKVF